MEELHTVVLGSYEEVGEYQRYDVHEEQAYQTSEGARRSARWSHEEMLVMMAEMDERIAEVELLLQFDQVSITGP